MNWKLNIENHQYLELAEAETCWRWNLVIKSLAQAIVNWILNIENPLPRQCELEVADKDWCYNITWSGLNQTFQVWSGYYERGHCRQLRSLCLVSFAKLLKISYPLTPIIHINNIAFCILYYCREPAIVKANAITAASEATCLLLSVDETVKNPRSDNWSQSKSFQVKSLDQFFPGLDRVQNRVACQEEWAGAGEDQCKTNPKLIFWFCLVKNQPKLIQSCSHLRLSGLLTPIT